MTNRYVIKFTKTGYVKYTSHLDLLRLFKRSFKKTGLALRYSQGFNPHPKMSFAQPLSLGYSGTCELIEFETADHHDTEEILTRLRGAMPRGIEIIHCEELSPEVKNLAGAAIAAEYSVSVPCKLSDEQLKKAMEEYLSQPEILAEKRQKKSKQIALVNIRDMIRSAEVEKKDDCAVIALQLDCGSTSNCSPELVISTFCKFADLDTPRYEIDVERRQILFSNNLHF